MKACVRFVDTEHIKMQNITGKKGLYKLYLRVLCENN